MAYYGHFKTAYLQKETIEDATVAAALNVGQLVTLADGALTAAAGASESAALGAATHIIAQSDQTLEYGHVPVENRDYRYSPVVAVSATKKKVALFKLVDKNDILTYTK